MTQNTHDALPRHIWGKGALFMCTLALTSVVAAVLYPELALSVNDLVRPDQIAARAQESHDREEILWFARAIYSESEFTEEQYYIAWAIRNRVESSLYPDTYEEVALQPHQFSGLNEYDPWYEVNISRDYGVGDQVWESALAVAQQVYAADDSTRLLPADAMHFYSPVAVAQPDWAEGQTPVETLPGKHGVRFAFYAGIR